MPPNDSAAPSWISARSASELRSLESALPAAEASIAAAEVALRAQQAALRVARGGAALLRARMLELRAMPLLDLPQDVLQHVLLPLLPLRDALALRATCREARAIVADAPCLWRRRYSPDCVHALRALHAVLPRAVHLDMGCFLNCAANQGAAHIATTCPFRPAFGRRKHIFSDGSVWNEDLWDIKVFHCQSIGVMLNDACLQSLRDIRVLCAQLCASVSDKSITALAGIEMLELHYLLDVTDDGLAALAGIKFLALHGSMPRVTPAALAPLLAGGLRKLCAPPSFLDDATRAALRAASCELVFDLSENYDEEDGEQYCSALCTTNHWGATLPEAAKGKYSTWHNLFTGLILT